MQTFRSFNWISISFFAFNTKWTKWKNLFKKKSLQKKNEQILCKNNQTVVGNGLRLQKKLWQDKRIETNLSIFQWEEEMENNK